MASMRECFAAVEKAIGRPPSEAEMEKIAEKVQERLRRKLASGMTPGDAARAAAEEFTAEAKVAKALAARERWENAVKFHDALELMNSYGTDRARAEQAFVSREHSGHAGAAMGIAETMHTRLRQLTAPALQAIDGVPGLLRVLRRGTDQGFELDLAKELRRLKSPDLEADTGNALAKKGAEILGPVLDAGRAMMNKAGAMIGEIEGYMGRQHHDMWKIRGAGNVEDFNKWRDTMLRDLNVAETFPDMTPADIARELHKDWLNHSSGIYNGSTSEALSGFVGGYNLGRKVSQERSYIFKDAESWVHYNREYGKGSVFDAIWSSAENAARNAAIMERLGTNPMAMWERIRQYNINSVKNQEGIASKAIDAVASDYTTNLLKNVLKVGDGVLPQNYTVAQWGATIRNAMQFIHLGAVALTSIPSDIVVSSLVLRHNGIPFFRGVMEQIQALMPQGRDARQLALSVGAGMDGATNHVIARFRVEDGLPGHMAEAVNNFHRWNGLAWSSDAFKAGVTRAIMHSLATHSNRGFAALDGMMQATLRRYGIEAAEWEHIRTAAQVTVDGRKYVAPGDIANKAVSEKVWHYLVDQSREALSETTATTRMRATLWSQPGTYQGEFVRMMMQFKTFQLSFMERSMGREFLRDGINYPGVITMAVGMTVAGLITNALKTVAAGQVYTEPKDAAGWAKIIVDGMKTGGGFSLLGDAVLRTNRTMTGDILRQYAGPAPTHAADAVAALDQFAFGSENLSRGQIAALKTIGGVQSALPNIPFAEAAIKYLFLHNLTEAVTPGAVARYNRRVRENGKEFILHP